jgi:hypothetical protein
MRNTLGKRQQVVLRYLGERREWYGGCGWHWGTYSETVRLMESLVRRGLVTKETCLHKHRGSYNTVYRPVVEAVR